MPSAVLTARWTRTLCAKRRGLEEGGLCAWCCRLLTGHFCQVSASFGPGDILFDLCRCVSALSFVRTTGGMERPSRPGSGLPGQHGLSRPRAAVRRGGAPLPLGPSTPNTRHFQSARPRARWRAKPGVGGSARISRTKSCRQAGRGAVGRCVCRPTGQGLRYTTQVSSGRSVGPAALPRLAPLETPPANEASDSEAEWSKPSLAEPVLCHTARVPLLSLWVLVTPCESVAHLRRALARPGEGAPL